MNSNCKSRSFSSAEWIKYTSFDAKYDCDHLYDDVELASIHNQSIGSTLPYSTPLTDATKWLQSSKYSLRNIVVSAFENKAGDFSEASILLSSYRYYVVNNHVFAY